VFGTIRQPGIYISEIPTETITLKLIYLTRTRGYLMCTSTEFNYNGDRTQIMIQAKFPQQNRYANYA
jgi:hypothetical protein